MATITRPNTFNRYDLHMALLITKREVRDSFRDWRIIIPIVILTLVFPALATMTARVLFNFTAQYGAGLIGDRLIPFLLLIVGFFPMSFSLVIALETFVGEKERKSLEPLLSTPLTNSQLYVGKVLAALIPPMITSYLGITVYIFGLSIAANWAIPTELFLQILLLSTLQGIIMVAAAVIVSSQTTSVRAANLLASFIIVPIALLLQLEAIVLFWGNSDGLWWLILALVVTAVIFIRMGIKIFNREELLGQDIDTLRVSWTMRQFRDRIFARDVDGRYPGPFGWYRETLSLIPKLELPGGTLLISFVGAIFLGIYLSSLYPIPEDIRSTISGAEIAANTSNLQFIFARLPLSIFLHNLRVIILAAFLGIITFGVTDILIFMLPWLIVGFLGGQLAISGENPLVFFLAAILPHAIFELPAILLASAATLHWHASILDRPENGSIGENWVNRAADFSRMFIGLVIPLLLIAAFVEAYITPKVILLLYGG
jgi:uncharacterized membrane protein SpoIIM required for sporulation